MFNKQEQRRRAQEINNVMSITGAPPSMPIPPSAPKPVKITLISHEGQELKVGDRVARGNKNLITGIEIRTVTQIENGKLYLDNSKVAINYPNRLVIVK